MQIIAALELIQMPFQFGTAFTQKISQRPEAKEILNSHQIFVLTQKHSRRILLIAQKNY
jgi:hypothetical protein